MLLRTPSASASASAALASSCQPTLAWRHFCRAILCTAFGITSLIAFVTATVPPIADFALAILTVAVLSVTALATLVLAAFVLAFALLAALASFT